MASRTFSTRSSTSATLAPPLLCLECHRALHPPHVIYLVEDAPKGSYRCHNCHETPEPGAFARAMSVKHGKKDAPHPMDNPPTPNRQERTESRSGSLWNRVSAALRSVVRLQGSREDDGSQSAPRRDYFPDGGPL